jgi:hypothetical protein
MWFAYSLEHSLVGNTDVSLRCKQEWKCRYLVWRLFLWWLCIPFLWFEDKIESCNSLEWGFISDFRSESSWKTEQIEHLCVLCFVLSQSGLQGEEWLRAEHAAALAGFWALLSEWCDITTATHWAKVVEWTGISGFQSYKASDALVYSKSQEFNWGSFYCCSAYLMISILFVQAKSLLLPQIIEMTLLKQSLLLPLPCSILLNILCTVCDNIVHLEGCI